MPDTRPLSPPLDPTDLPSLVQYQASMIETLQQQLAAARAEFEQSLARQRALESRVIRQEKGALVQTLAGGIAHEISNKLMPIMGYSELMLETEGISDDLRACCQVVHNGAADVARIIRQLLQLSRPGVPDLAVVSLRDLVTDSLSFVQGRLDSSHLTLDVQLPEDDVRVKADSTQVKQVIVNLLVNALDAMDGLPTGRPGSDRGLQISLEARDRMARLAVRDRGHGIPSELLERIFDPFFTTKGPDRGVGLGLSVSLAIVEQHGGTLQVESTSGDGSTFHVALPTSVAQSDESEEPGLPRERDLFESAPPLPLAVLVVDDDEPTARMIQRALQTRLGCTVHTRCQGPETIDDLRQHSYAAVVFDGRMPGFNGVQLIEWLVVHRPDLMPRLIFTTGDTLGSSLNLHLAKLGFPLLEKPFTLDQLHEHLRRIVGDSVTPTPALDAV